MGFILIVLAIVVGLLLYLVGAYNKFVRKRAMMEEGWSGIDVQLKKRHDLIPNLIETVKGYARHEQETLSQVIEARNAALQAEGVKQQTQAENQLNSALANVFALGEAYPDLKANTNFIHLQQELSGIEDGIEKARRYYNATVRENNIMVESFPTNFLANGFNFDLADYFEIDDPGERSVPKVKF